MNGSLPLLTDWTALGLAVVAVETVARISDEDFTISAPAGSILLVVTLSGTAAKKCYLAATTREFGAIFEEPPRMPHSRQKSAARIVQAGAVAFSGERWVVNDARRLVTFSRYFDVPGPVAVRIALSLPEYISEFSIRIPAAITVRIPSAQQN